MMQASLEILTYSLGLLALFGGSFFAAELAVAAAKVKGN